MGKLYKVLVNGKSCHGGSFGWSLPTDGKAGEWHEVSGPLEMCSNGFHLTDAPTWWWKAGCAVFEVETEGEVLGVCDDLNDRKVVARKVRLVREVTAAPELAELGIYIQGEHDAKNQKIIVAYDSAQVTAYDSAQVKAYGSAQVTAYGSAQVTAYGSAQVKAYGSAQVTAYDSAQVTAYGSAQVTAKNEVTLIVFWGDPKVELHDFSVLVDRRSRRKPVIKHAKDTEAA